MKSSVPRHVSSCWPCQNPETAVDAIGGVGTETNEQQNKRKKDCAPRGWKRDAQQSCAEKPQNKHTVKVNEVPSHEIKRKAQSQSSMSTCKSQNMRYTTPPSRWMLLEQPSSVGRVVESRFTNPCTSHLPAVPRTHSISISNPNSWGDRKLRTFRRNKENQVRE